MANETERPPFPSPESTENCWRSKLRIFLDESCVRLWFVTLKLTIQRNKERFWQLEQTAKPKKANISLWYKSSSKGITVLKEVAPRVSKHAVSCFGAKGLESSVGHVHAVNSNLPVHWLQTDRKKTERKANKEKVLRLQQSHIHYLGLSTQLAAAYYSSSSSAWAGSWILYTAKWVCLSTSTAWLSSVYTQLLRGTYMWVYTVCVYACRCVS